MLKGIDPVLIGTLLKELDEMGHGDLVALVDRNYPATSSGRPVVHLGEIGVVRATEAILSVFPLDTFISNPLGRMESDDQDPATDIHAEVLRVARAHHPLPLDYRLIPRSDFYTSARDCYLIIQCLETAPYSCFLLQKGVV